MNAEPGTRSSNDIAGHIPLPHRASLTHEEIHDVVSRNSVGCVYHKLEEGTIRTSRVRYAHEGSTLYIPAWPSIESWYAARFPSLECHVSELDWRSWWRCVRLRGHVIPLHPTGAPREREAWHKAVAALRRRIVDMAPTDELTVTNFGVVQIDIEFWEGAGMAWEDPDQASTAIGHAPETADTHSPESSRSDAPFLIHPRDEAAASNRANWIRKIPDLLVATLLFAYSSFADLSIDMSFFAG